MAITTARQARKLLGKTGGGTSPARGEEIYDFVRKHQPESCLELGFAHGVGSVYVAAALEANGKGKLTGVDTVIVHERDPSAQSLVDAAGLAHRVEFVYEQTSYTWFLHDALRRQLRDDHIEPLYDFVFIDGAHSWDADALAFALVDRLVKPGGWILLDDLDWTMDAELYPDVPAYQRDIPQVRAIWELLALTNSSYDRFETEGQWGWMRKSDRAVATSRTVVKRDLVGSLREAGRIARRKLRR